MTSTLIDVAGLVTALQQLPSMPPAERARAARALSDAAKTALAEVGDAAVVEALQGATYKEVATQLDVSEAAVNKAVTRHRRRLAERGEGA
jgi:DNA-directed RNA polymerase specialized sigma24 family protein